MDWDVRWQRGGLGRKVAERWRVISEMGSAREDRVRDLHGDRRM